MLSEQVLPNPGWLGELGRKVLALEGLHRGSGFHFSASASQRRAAKVQLSLSTLPALPALDPGRRQASLKHSAGLKQGWPACAPISQPTSVSGMMPNTSINTTLTERVIKSQVIRCSQVFACMQKYNKRALPIHVNSFYG